jgi:DNA-binding MarR family transcriptional regulator
LSRRGRASAAASRVHYPLYLRRYEKNTLCIPHDQPAKSLSAAGRRRRLDRAIKESLRDLNAQLSLLNHHVGGRLDRLERAGWIARDRDLADRRGIVVRTLRGRAAELPRPYSGMNSKMDQLCAGYDEDQLELLADFLRHTTNAGQRAADELAAD